MIRPVEDLLERFPFVRVDREATAQPVRIDVQVVGLPEVDLRQVLVQVKGQLVQDLVLRVADRRLGGIELVGVDALVLGDLQLAGPEAGAIVVDAAD